MLETLSAEAFTGYLLGNVIKYTRRAGLKVGTNDAAKAEQYTCWLAEFKHRRTITLNGKLYTRHPASGVGAPNNVAAVAVGTGLF